MKRTVSIIALAMAALMMLACFAGCAEQGGQNTEATEKPVLAGSYKLVEVGGDAAEVFKDIMDTVTLDIDSTGKGTLKSGENQATVQFDESTGKAENNGSSVPFTFDGKKLTLEDSTGKLVFEKQ